MARELDSEMLRRLQESYCAMSDRELQELAAKPDALTDLALEVLRGEMTRRGVEPAEDDTPARDGAGQGRATEGYGAVKPVRTGFVVLMTFYDAIAAGDACRYLETDGMELDVQDVSEPSTMGGSFYGGPPVALQVRVPAAEEKRAQRILREKMKLFPLQEVEGDDLPDKDGMATLGCFGLREDADDVGRILEEADVWHRVVANEEGAAETEDAWNVEVREADQARALETVEKSMGMAEE